MNRPIKFRIWDTETKTFLQELAPYYWHVPRSLGLFDNEIVGEANLHDLSTLLSNNGFVIQQFTGLLDKNGREIYEGDIVETDPEHITAILKAKRESEEYTKYTSGVVTWVNEGFCVCQPYIGATRISEYSDCDCCPCGLIIIGNKFENPELLKTHA